MRTKKTSGTAGAGAKPRKGAARKSGSGRSGTKAASRPSGTSSDKLTIRRLRAQLAQAEARIVELQASAETDFLLDIPNRRGFERALVRALAFIKRYHAAGALIVLDVDRLKPINDAFGHVAGDTVLKAIVETMSGQVRSSDVIGRLGGDEFAVLLWNLTAADAMAKAAALEEAIDELSFVFQGQRVTTGASAGVAILGQHSDVARAIDEADRAMYVRKAQRRHETPN